MTMQDRPVCFLCDRVIEYDPVYEAPCGHEEHSSAVWHGLCLMEFREKRDEWFKEFRRRLMRMAEEMREYGILEEDE